MKVLYKAVALAAVAMTAGAVQAGTVQLTAWAHEPGVNVGNRIVTMTNSTPGSPTFGPQDVYAGAFSGTVNNFTGGQSWVNTALPNSFVTYCVEFTQNFTLPMSTPIDYDLVAGSAYSHWGADAATIANRLGSLLTHVNGLANPVDTYKESAAVQLAIWETIYEKPVGVDLDLNNGNLTETRGGAINAEIRTLANGYLNGTDYTRSIYDVFVLSNATRQDFIALREGGGFQQNVPEPGALALSLAALGALGVASRRRRAG